MIFYPARPEGRIHAAGPALLGSRRGDDAVPGLGKRKAADIHPEERVTPAGRFVAEIARDANDEDILWLDREAALSMRRVGDPDPARLSGQRLATPMSADKRITNGAIELPTLLFDRVVKPAFEPHAGIVYILPETRPAMAMFDAYQVGPK